MTTRNLLIVATALIVSVGVDVAWGKSIFPGYGATVGLLGSFALVVVTNWLGKTVLDRPEEALGIDAPLDEHADLHQADGWQTDGPRSDSDD